MNADQERSTEDDSCKDDECRLFRVFFNPLHDFPPVDGTAMEKAFLAVAETAIPRSFAADSIHALTCFGSFYQSTSEAYWQAPGYMSRWRISLFAVQTCPNIEVIDWPRQRRILLSLSWRHGADGWDSYLSPYVYRRNQGRCRRSARSHPSRRV
jgi:hypothetical protein